MSTPTLVVIFLVAVLVSGLWLIWGTRRKRDPRLQLDTRLSHDERHSKPRPRARRQAADELTETAGFAAQSDDEADYLDTLKDLSARIQEVRSDNKKAAAPVRAAPAATDIPQMALDLAAADPLADQAGSRRLERVLALYVRAKIDQRVPTAFDGGDLLDALAAVGMRFGEMEIFHYYHCNPQGQTYSLFSVANMLEPGAFNMGEIQNFSTPGIVMFMRLPLPIRVQGGAGVVFDLMAETARHLAERLNGEVLDDAFKPLTVISRQIMRTHADRP